MAKFEIPEDVGYSDDVRKFETSDPAHASLFNEAVEKLLHNIAWLKKIADSKDNPHKVTKRQVELGDVDNTSDANKPVSDAVKKELDDINNGLNEAKKSVSDGKGKIAAAVTRKKVATAAGDSFDIMAGNIDKIKLGSGNATPDKVLQGATFTNDSGVEQAGTMPGRGGTSNLAIDKEPFMYEGELVQYMPTGYYAGTVVEGFAETKHRGTIPLDKVVSATGISADKIMANHQVCGVTGTATADANITPDTVLSGSKGYSQGQAVNGAIPIYNTATSKGFGIHLDYFYERFSYGYYQNANGDGTSEARIPLNTFINDMGITADKIMTGREICGVGGTATVENMAEVKTAEANFSANASGGDNWYSGNVSVTFDFAHKILGIVSVEKVSGNGNWSCTGGKVSGNSGAIGFYTRAVNVNNSGKIRITAIGY